MRNIDGGLCPVPIGFVSIDELLAQCRILIVIIKRELAHATANQPVLNSLLELAAVDGVGARIDAPNPQG